MTERKKPFERMNEGDAPQCTDEPNVPDTRARLAINSDELPQDCDKGNRAVEVILTDAVGE
jgi:hypothetical protein